MKKISLKIAMLALVALIAFPSWSATTPKREHRSVWITTAWRMCWPTDYGTSTSVATSQKNEAIKYLDLLKENGFNCVYFQVRGMSDAMYKSSYEPWSSYVSGTRGSAPAYDPLEFWVSECHKRGMEIFAWVNPYRYESSVSGASWTGSKDYRTTNPDWIMEYNNASILNPGIKAVQTRIIDVCREIVGNYDVDGLVFDDYFYLNSVPTSYDSDLYKSSGSSLSQADWRRENVNSMVRGVYNMIQSTKPYVKFGISPAGVSKTSASKYGISTSSISSASDWQYSQIYSDPLAWLGEGTVDFISPQIYWVTTHSTNPYGSLSKWWSDACADVFGRHFYSSISISLLEGANTTTNWAELAKQVQCNRDYTGNDAPGSVFFGSRDLTGKRNSGFADYLKQYKFQNIALPPCITWKSSYAYNPGKVTGLALSGSTLSWNGYDNMRYVVYAVPENTTISGEINSQYIIGNPYATSLDVTGYTSGYKLGVSVFDRYGNEYDVTWLGGDEEDPGTGDEEDETKELERTTINTPADGSTVQSGFTFSWTANAVSGVSYRLEVATSNTFSNVVYAATTSATSYSSANMSLTEGTKYYWRVITSKEGYTSSTSWVGSFTMATSGSSTPSTPTDVVKDPNTYNNVNGYSIESLWIYSVNTSNFHSSLGGDQRGMAALDGKVYISQRDGHLLEFDGATGELLRTITLTGDCFTDKDGNELQFECQDLFVDAGNHLCMSSMTLDCSSVPLTICTVDVATGATTRVFNMTTTLGGRIDYVAVRGDVTQTSCELWAAVANSNYVYRWVRNASGYWAIAATTVSTYYPSSITTNSTAPRIMPISNTQFILDAHNSAPALYTFSASGTATYNDGFGNNTAIAPSENNWNGVSQATLNGTPIFAYVSAIAPNTFTIVTNPSNFSFKKMSKLWTVPANGLGSEANSYVTSKPTMVNNSDGSVTMYIYTPNNGLAAYKLKSTTSTDVTPQLDAVSLSTPVGGTTVSKGFSFGWGSITGATYTLEVSKSSSFSNVAFTATTTSNSYSSSNFNLEANTTYYWRVKASKDGYLSSTSSVASFKTAQETLNAVTLTSPIGGATVEDGFTFNWSAISGATYTLEISAVATFASIMYTLESSTNSYSSASLDFADGTKYYWRVKANKSGSTQSTSAVESFTTKQTTVTPTPTPDEENKENVEYPVTNNLSIKNLWIYAIQKGNFHEELGRDQRGMAAYNGKVYISERASGAGYLLEFDGNSGEYLRKITLTGDYSSLSGGYTLGYPCNDVFVDGGNHLCVANMITSSSASSQLNISIVDVETGNTTRVFETDISDASLRIDNCMAWGDLTKKGSKVFAAPSSHTTTTYRKRIYCWTRDNDYDPTIVDIYNEWTLGYNGVRKFYPSTATSFGNAPRVLPVGSTRVIVDGSTVYPTLYSYNTSWNGATSSIEDDFSSNSAIKPAGMLSAGMCTGEINGRNLYIYSFNDDMAEFHNFAILNNPSDFDFAEMEVLWKVPQAGLGNVGNSYVSSIPATQQNADGSLNLYIYTPFNGLAAYRIDDPTTSVEGLEINGALNINAYNKRIECSKVANSIELFTVAGVKVAEISNSKVLNVADIASGIYLVRATTDDETISETVVIK